MLTRLKNLHSNIASDVWPDGGKLRCKVCDWEQEFIALQAADYLAHGWPKHCGQTMLLDALQPPAAPEPGERE